MLRVMRRTVLFLVVLVVALVLGISRNKPAGSDDPQVSIEQ
jgi:hypothetical protein